MKKLGLLLTGLLLTANLYAFGSSGCDNNATVLLHMDNGKASTTFVDSNCTGTGGIAVTNNGSPGISQDTVKVQFGPTAAVFDGGSRYLSLGINNATKFNGDFTIDGWFYTNVNTTDTQFRELFATGSEPTAGFAVVIDGSGFLNIIVNDSIVGSVGTRNLNDGKWHHVEMDRSGSGTNNIGVYLDGVLEAGPISNNTDWSGQTFVLGIYVGTFTTGRWNGYMDEVRVSLVARHPITSPALKFTPPSTPYCESCEMTGEL